MKQDLKEIAEILSAIADGAEWEYQTSSGEWASPITTGPINYIADGWEVRIKPRTITINGIEVPEPVRESLEQGQSYWTAYLLNKDYCYSSKWLGGRFDYQCLERGIIHLTKEAAATHGRALASFSEQPTK